MTNECTFLRNRQQIIIPGKKYDSCYGLSSNGFLRNDEFVIYKDNQVTSYALVELHD